MFSATCAREIIIECSSTPLPSRARFWLRLRDAATSRVSIALALIFIAPVAKAKEETAVRRLQDLTIEELLQVEVTSVSGYTEKLNDAPSAIQVIRNVDLNRSTASTLAEAMCLANNLNVAQKNPHDWAISARGFNANVGNKLLVLIDGRSVYTPLFAGVFWNAQDYLLQDIEQIEVISGPGGTLWGANAVNGVININTKSARDTQGVLVEAGRGDELHHTLAVRYGGQAAPKVHFRVYGKFLTADPGVLDDGRKASNGWKQGQGGFRVDAVTSASDTVTVQGDLYAGDLAVQSGDSARLGGGNLLGRWSRQGTDSSETQVPFYVDHTHIAVPFAASPFAPAGFLKDNLNTYDLALRHSARLGLRQRLTGGIGHRLMRDGVEEQAPNVAILPARLTRSRPSLFLQDDNEVSDNLVVTVGSKLEHNDYTGLKYEPTARLKGNFAPRQNAWAAASRAVRMPSRFDRHLYEPAPPLSLVAGGPDFISETVIAYEAGYRAQPAPWLSGSVSVFYNEYDHLRSWGATPVTTLPIIFQNNLQAKTHGFELNADAQVAPWWRLNAGFNFMRENVWRRPGTFDLQNALDETVDPRHQLAVHSRMDLPRQVELDVSLRWVDTLRINHGGLPGTVPAYTELDIRLAWQVTRHVQFAQLGRNLLHNQHAEYGSPGPGREELQRSVFAKITWRN